MTKLIIGLGNPGKEYKNTRHNFGFMAINFLNQDLSASSWEKNKKTDSLISEIKINNQKLILAKPQTMMNNSGQAAIKLLNYYRIEIKDLIIIHDDIDLNLGDYKIQQNRGSAGHKGIESIIQQLDNKEFTRLRLGIKTEQIEAPTEKFVLQKFSESEMEIVNQTIKKAVRDLRTAIENN